MIPQLTLCDAIFERDVFTPHFLKKIETKSSFKKSVRPNNSSYVVYFTSDYLPVLFKLLDYSSRHCGSIQSRTRMGPAQFSRERIEENSSRIHQRSGFLAARCY